MHHCTVYSGTCIIAVTHGLNISGCNREVHAYGCLLRSSKINHMDNLIGAVIARA